MPTLFNRVMWHFLCIFLLILQHIIQRRTPSIADCGKKIAAIKQSTMFSIGMMIGVSWCSSLCGDV